MMHQKLIFTSFRNCEKISLLKGEEVIFFVWIVAFFSNAHDVAREIGG